MSCPYVHDIDDETSTHATKHGDDKKMSYSDYLQLNMLLDSQKPVSSKYRDSPVHDEHLFIVVHQAYELWFKQILHELNSIMDFFTLEELPDSDAEPTRQLINIGSLMKNTANHNRANLGVLFLNQSGKKGTDERKMLVLISRLGRIVHIQKLLLDQITIIETMTPLDFLDFREYLAPASGFQSLQFRLIENKLGINKKYRSSGKYQDYSQAFDSDHDGKEIQQSECTLSLLDLVQRWLERTPGLEENGFDFWGKYKKSVQNMLDVMKAEAEVEEDEEVRANLFEEVEKQTNHFDSLFNEERHNQLTARGQRRFSHKAMQGALMIYFYRDEPRFNQPFQILQLLIDMDSYLMKWRYNHVMMVHRMIGSRVGTFSSGYHYLKSTVSDRYKVFIDLFNLSNFIIPRDRIPPLNSSIKVRLRTALVDGRLYDSDSAVGSDGDEEDQMSAATSIVKSVAITTS